jgi:acetyl esterase/lipase
MGIQLMLVKIFIRIIRKFIFSKSIIKTRSRIKFFGKFQRRPKKGVISKAVIINQVHAEWFIPENAPAQKVLLYLHGSGYCLCSVSTHRNLISRLAHASGVKVLSPWLDLTCSSRSFAYNAHVDPVLPAREFPHYAESYAGTASIKNPYISPIFGDPSKLPPISIHVGTSEILFDNSLLFFVKALKHGVDAHIEIWPQMFHVFQLAARFVSEGKESITMLGRFIREHLEVR